ncbi:hypothetical protein PVAP13_4KG346000 [Panicum virgatum]|uniref:Uncharacterized protein n=1 Tax=Panicum virgatum TaxID=38727 RepID=A0A8T0TWT3_PANVG|nr:hypothetical protein PVAP13_4KG346000 [Panicum virgatum]
MAGAERKRQAGANSQPASNQISSTTLHNWSLELSALVEARFREGLDWIHLWRHRSKDPIRLNG